MYRLNIGCFGLGLAQVDCTAKLAAFRGLRKSAAVKFMQKRVARIVPDNAF
jgi:hypothetical protein